MNYPLGEAILGFVGANALDVEVVRSHHEYAGRVIPRDGGAFGRHLEDLLRAYDPATTAVQLNLLGSHDAPRIRTVLGGDIARVGLAVLLQATLPGAPCLYYGDEIGLAGGNDPECRGAFAWDRTRWAPGLHDTVRALFRLRSLEPALRDGPVAVVGAADTAIAYERGSGPARFVVVVNPGATPARLTLRFADAPSGHGGHLAPIELPGLGGVAEAPINDGQAELVVSGLGGGVLRIV